MHEINYKNLKKGYKSYGLLFVMGIILLVVLGWMLVFRGPIKKLSMDSNVKAYDVKLNEERTSAIYYYEVNGKKYEYTFPYTSNIGLSRMISQDTIYYNSSNPSDCIVEYETKLGVEDIFLTLFLLIFPIMGLKGILNVRKNIKRIKRLSKNGTLIRGLKYRLVYTGKKVNKRRIMAIQVDYELPSGSVIKLTGEPRYDLITYNEEGCVDLLIDPNDCGNYYIDFNIN